jgi:hypothetical protein
LERSLPSRPFFLAEHLLFNVNGWSWSGATGTVGTGLTVSGLIDSDAGDFDNYTLGIRFSFGQVDAFRRLIRFADSDLGMYIGDFRFQFYDNISFPTGGSIASGVPVDFVLTRDGSLNQVKAYPIDYTDIDNVVADLLFTVTDSTNIAESADGTLQFFRDQTGGTEFSDSGTASLIRIWDAPLDATDIPTSMIPVPEPATMTLLAVAATGSLLLWMRCRRTA